MQCSSQQMQDTSVRLVTLALASRWAPAWGHRLLSPALEVTGGNQLWGSPAAMGFRCSSFRPCGVPSPGAQHGRGAIFLNTSQAGLGSAQHATKTHIHPNPLLSPLQELGFVFKSIWQATKLAESVSWLATRSKNAVLSPPSFPLFPPGFFFSFT